MSKIILNRDELKLKIINDGIIDLTLPRSYIRKSRISENFRKSVIEVTKKCRDNFTERLYWILNDIHDYPNCDVCNIQFQPNFHNCKSGYDDVKSCSHLCGVHSQKRKDTCMERYGVEHSSKSIIVHQTREKNYLEKTGYSHSFQNPEVKQKLRKTNLKKFGFENPAQNELIKEKIRKAYAEKTDDEIFNANEKRRVTNLEKNGYEYPGQNPKSQENRRATCLEKYGVEHQAQNAEVHEQQQKFRSYKFTLDTGYEITYQGYENVAIKKLLETYNETEVVIRRKDIPLFWYLGEDEKQHRYFPDIFIPSENLIIEVKSTRTYNCEFNKNQLKKKACLDAGYNFKFWICSNKEVLEIIC